MVARRMDELGKEWEEIAYEGMGGALDY